MKQHDIRRGDIYQALLDPTAGHEQSGRRPVVVISPTKFNNVTGLPVILPITNNGKFAKRLGFTVPVQTEANMVTGFIRCDQPRAIDLSDRDAHKMDTMSKDTMIEVLDKVVVLFQEET